MQKEVMPPVHFIILNYLNYTDTINTVYEVLRQKKIKYKIIIVDNKSPNESLEKLNQEFRGNEYIEIIQSERNGGYSYGNNFGLRHIKKYDPQYVCILNNDILIPDEHIIFKLIQEYDKHENAFLCAPSMFIDDKETKPAWKIPSYTDLLILATRLGGTLFNPSNRYKFAKEKRTEIVECVAGSFFLCDYRKFEKLKFFEEEIFLFGEETILAQKIKDIGGINLLCRQLNYEHLWSKSINNEVNKVQRVKLQLYGRELFLRKYTNASWIKFMLLKCLHLFRILEESARIMILKIVSAKN